MCSPYEVAVLFNGYSKIAEEGFLANCSCTLVKGPKNIIVDTMTSWDGAKIVGALKAHKLNPADISYVVCSHGHSDHIGCNYLFQDALHIVGHCISRKDIYYMHDFKSGHEYEIDDYVKIVPTPGHTLQDVSVIVKTRNRGIVAITGDLFENETDLEDDNIWKAAGSDSVEVQIESRNKILKIANWIVPGHGTMFKVERSG